MLVDTKQIITKTQLRENLSKLLLMVYKSGQELIVSDRGKMVVKLTPVVEPEEKGNDTGAFLSEVKNIRKKLSRKNPKFDSLEALKEVRNEN